MTHWFFDCLLIFAFAIIGVTGTAAGELWSHVKTVDGLGERRESLADWAGSDTKRILRLEVTGPGSGKYGWASVPAPAGGWDLASRQTVRASIANRGRRPVDAMMWVVAGRGWSAVGDFATLPPGESREFVCDLRESFPDGTPKLDPGRVAEVRFMTFRPGAGTILEVSGLRANGLAPSWKRPEGRLEIPDMETGPPAAGRRVRYQFGDDEKTGIYLVLYLPERWKGDETDSFPLIVEYPGNIFLNRNCYSTGRPEQCVIGYGMSEGEVIWVSLPFVDRESETIVEDGFGNAGDTAAYAKRAVRAICQDFGGDPENVILTGFSRGSIACGYIGLRDDAIAGLWKGIHGCQHYDGSSWRQSTLEGAVERAPRFSGRAVFQTDNSREKYQPVVDATDPSVEWTWARSGLGFHDTAMFLDDRPSTRQLREWYRKLISSP